jgi:hypothetical protein
MMGLDFHWDAYRELMHSLKTGRSASELVMPEGLFPRLKKNPEHGRIFNEAMMGKSVGMIGPVLAAFDFSVYSNEVLHRVCAPRLPSRPSALHRQ